ncbi:MAG TPA: polysaccharide deacetylase family protein [Polyangiales bacterium]
MARPSTTCLSTSLALLVLGCHAPCPAARATQPDRPGAVAAGVAAYGPIPVAVTFDDLPGAVDPTPGYPKSQVMADVIASLRAHGLRRVVGFANGIAVSDADTELALARWTEAGFELGNHTFSHLGPRELGPAAFLHDVERNQRFLSERTKAPPRYFRFPYLERGNTPDERVEITRALAQGGYRVANVSIDFADWAYVAAYTRCGAARDEAALAGLSQSYLQSAMHALFWSVEAGQRLFGRTIPQVLLLHVQVPTARNLDALLDLYEEQGVTWITLEEALRDPVFAEPPDVDHGDTSALAEAIRAQHADLRSSVPRPLSLLELACR